LVDLLCCIFLGLLADSFTEQKGVAKKVMSDSAGMVSFGIGLVHSVLNSPDGLVKFFWDDSDNRRTATNPACPKFFQAM